MKKLILGLLITVAGLSALIGHINQKDVKTYEPEVTMHRGYIEDVGLPDGPGR